MINATPIAIDAAGAKAPLGWPSIAAGANNNITAQLGRSCFKEFAVPATATAYVGSYYWLYKIPLTMLHPIFKELSLSANCQLKLRLRINQGQFAVKCTTAGLGYSLKESIMSSGTTCPLMLAFTYTGSPLDGRLGTGTELHVEYGAINHAFSNPTLEGDGYFPFNLARLYVPLYELANPTQLISNPIKTISYLDCYAQMFDKRSGLGVSTQQLNAPFNFQLAGSFRSIKYVALLPFAETSAGNYTTAHGVPQFQSPMDSCPGTLHPGSAIRTLQIQIGGDNVFNDSKEYDFSSFRDEVSKLAAINGDLDNRLNCGLLDENQWSYTNCVLVADVSRMTNPDVPASVVVSGVVGSSQGSNILVLVVNQRELEHDVLTGEVMRAD